MLRTPTSPAAADPRPHRAVDAVEVFVAFLRLGLTSFGGPVAHLGYFRDDFVGRRRWLDEESYAHIVALCQLLPGPASSQVGIIIGYRRAGVLGSFAAWCGFTLPSAFALVAFAYGTRTIPSAGMSGWIHGLLIAAVAVVALAVARMFRSLAPDGPRRLLVLVVAAGAVSLPANGFTQLAFISLGALFGSASYSRSRLGRVASRAVAAPTTANRGAIPTGLALASAVGYVALMIGLPLVGHFVTAGPLVAFARFFEVGGLVFGGGHVVLPLLQAQVVTAGWISNASFLAGYGAAQAVPGPLFSFAAYLGAAMVSGPVHGISGAALCLVAIFLPSFLLVAASLTFWDLVRRNALAAAALRGMNAAVVGLLLAALYDPLWISAIHSLGDVVIALGASLALGLWRAPAWSVVLGSALIAGLIARLT